MESQPDESCDLQLQIHAKKQLNLDGPQITAWDALVGGASRREAGHAASVSASTVCNWVKRWRRELSVEELFRTPHDATAAEALGARWSERRAQTSAEAVATSFMALEAAEHALSKVHSADDAAEAKRWADVARGSSIIFGVLVDKADQLAVPLVGALPELSREEAKAQVMELVEKIKARKAAVASGQA